MFERNLLPPSFRIEEKMEAEISSKMLVMNSNITWHKNTDNINFHCCEKQFHTNCTTWATVLHEDRSALNNYLTEICYTQRVLARLLMGRKLPVFQVKQRDSSQGDQSLGTQCGQSSVPHFCIVGGVGRPASSHRLLSTFCVVLCRRTIQCAALT